MICVEDLHVIFNKDTPLEAHALRGVNLKIEEGEFVTVIGSNGAGKSTFLNSLSGEIEAESGHIYVDEKDVVRLSASGRSASMARVFQDPMAGTCAHLSIEENMALAFARGKGRSLTSALKASRREIFRTHLKRLGLGLEDRLSDPMGSLSGGQRQAVSLVMAVMNPMQILLLDEHTAALDPKTAAFVLKLTREIVAEKNLTALMVTHSMQQALSIGTRTVMFHQGKIVLDIKGEERNKFQVSDLLDLFSNDKEVIDDALLLG